MNDNDERRAALDRIPLPYSEALRLRDAGIAQTVIADILGVEPESLSSLMELGEAKLAAVFERERE